MLHVSLDGFKESGAYLSFNAVLFDDETGLAFYSLGWRLHNKILMPPASRGRGNRYWDVAHISPELARKFHRILVSKSGMLSKFPSFAVPDEESFLETTAVWDAKEAKHFFPETNA